MLKLIKLEIKKSNFKKHILSYIITMLCIIGFCGLIGSLADDGERTFNTAKDIMVAGNLFIRITFTIFAGVLLGGMVIGEYKNSTINLMFTYPISRKKIMSAKLIIVFVFTFVAIVVGNILYFMAMSGINMVTHMIPEPITISTLFLQFPSIFFSALVTSGLSLISLYFGMRKKSVTTTVVASVVLGFLLNGQFGDTSESMASLYSIAVVPIILCICGIGIALMSYRTINKKDVK